MSAITIESLSGFAYFPEFLSSAQSRELLEYVRSLPMKHDVFCGKVMRRASYNLGYDYLAIGRRLTPVEPFSEPIRELAARAKAHCGCIEKFDECSITNYGIGAGIGWHTDARFFGDYILGVSLGADGRMQFRPNGGSTATGEVTVAPGSLYIMTGPARWDYQHRIVPVKAD